MVSSHIIPLLQKICVHHAGWWEPDEPTETEVKCEEQSDAAVDCGIHTARAFLHELEGTQPEAFLRGQHDVDRAMKVTRLMLRAHFEEASKDYCELHPGVGNDCEWTIFDLWNACKVDQEQILALGDNRRFIKSSTVEFGTTLCPCPDSQRREG